jgi:hypothetical protein
LQLEIAQPIAFARQFCRRSKRSSRYLSLCHKGVRCVLQELHALQVKSWWAGPGKVMANGEQLFGSIPLRTSSALVSQKSKRLPSSENLPSDFDAGTRSPSGRAPVPLRASESRGRLPMGSLTSKFFCAPLRSDLN